MCTSGRGAATPAPADYREIAAPLARRGAMGFTHVELMPITEHPFYGSWGTRPPATSPPPRARQPQDFIFLVDTLHQAGSA